MSAVTPNPPEPGAVSEESLTTRWRHAPEVAVTGDVGSRFVLIDLARPVTPPRVLTDSAALIWDAADHGRTTVEIVRTVAEQVGLPSEALGHDVEQFLLELHGTGLLVTGSTGTTAAGTEESA